MEVVGKVMTTVEGSSSFPSPACDPSLSCVHQPDVRHTHKQHFTAQPASFPGCSRRTADQAASSNTLGALPHRLIPSSPPCPRLSGGDGVRAASLCYHRHTRFSRAACTTRFHSRTVQTGSFLFFFVLPLPEKVER